MACDSHLLSELSEISAHEVIELLCHEFSMGRSWITFVTTGNRVEIRSFLSASYLEGIAANDVGPIEFWGGPPPQQSYQKGTLLTYLCDIILHHWVMFGTYADLVLREPSVDQIRYASNEC